ncbi:hypothetical protein [Noviherbaspirillum aerium]|uniref:hypothetical protein n=1 Tax=Noviherbaspirillum aerium TaxID=2588497 RepID=UPI00124D4EB0|nr:hypothetical protein [Noviherbaspirillum aerium]
MRSNRISRLLLLCAAVAAFPLNARIYKLEDEANRVTIYSNMPIRPSAAKPELPKPAEPPKKPEPANVIELPRSDLPKSKISTPIQEIRPLTAKPELLKSVELPKKPEPGNTIELPKIEPPKSKLSTPIQDAVSPPIPLSETGVSTQISPTSSVDYPRISPIVQKTRDSERLSILNNELQSEQTALAEAEARNAPGEILRRYRKNIEALRREISNSR